MQNVKFIINQLNTAIGPGPEEEFEYMAVRYLGKKGYVPGKLTNDETTVKFPKI